MRLMGSLAVVNLPTPESRANINQTQAEGEKYWQLYSKWNGQTVQILRDKWSGDVMLFLVRMGNEMEVFGHSRLLLHPSEVQREDNEIAEGNY